MASHVHVQWKSVLVPGGNQYKPREFAAPLIASDGKTAWLGAANGMSAIRVADGSLLWRTATPEPIVGRPVMVTLPGEASQTLMAATMAGAVYAMEPGTGKPRWSQPSRLDVPVRANLAADERFVFVAADPGSIQALDLASGKPVWRWSVTIDRDYLVEGQGAPLVLDGVVYVGTPTGKIAALSARDGALLWETTLEQREKSQFGDVDSTPVAYRAADGSVLVLAASHSGGLCAVNAADGKIIWRYEVEGLGQPLLTPAGIAAVSALGEVHLVSKAGVGIAARKLASTAAGTLAWSQGLLLVPTESGMDLLRVADLRTIYHLASESGMSAAPVMLGSFALLMANSGVAYGLFVDPEPGAQPDIR